jgi:hypothetical protein
LPVVSSKSNTSPALEVADLAVAGLDAGRAAQEDEELPPRRRVPVAAPAGWRAQEAEARHREKGRHVERRGRGCEVDGVERDGDVLEVGLTLGASVEAHVLH